MRDSISLGAGFSKEEREEHNLRVARLAKVLSEQGNNIIVSVIAPFQATRDKINKVIDCKWVYLKRELNTDKHRPYEPPAECFTLDIDNMTVEQEVKEVVEKLRLFNVFVFGLPRSGTSMMTKIVELLGVKMVYTSENDEKRQEMNRQYKEKLGEYHPNKQGFFEITENILSNYFKIIASPYSGCKMIIPVQINDKRMFFVKFNPYNKVIQMWREPEEIRQSQQAFYRGDCLEDADARISYFRSSLAGQQSWLEQLKIDSLHISYREVLKNPKKLVSEVAEFINSPNDISDAVKSVKPDMNRFKKEELEVGI
jgi:hypothetical protein